MCVEGTLRDASDRGFGCVLVEDACGADTQEYHDAALTVIQRLYGHVLSTNEVLDRLAGWTAGAGGAVERPVAG